MSALDFVKMHGCGNDFIMIDDRAGVWRADWSRLTRIIAAPHTGLGADGVIFIADRDRGQGAEGDADFAMVYVNRDGEIGEMCGNGARCTAAFADQLGLVTESATCFSTGAGRISARVDGSNVTLQMTPPRDFKARIMIAIDGRDYDFDFIDTGVPHAACLVADVDAIDVVRLGKMVRYHEIFAPRGTNVNFYHIVAPNHIRVRTYERGVENETLACGTGSVACALIARHHGHVARMPVKVQTSSGIPVYINFAQDDAGHFTDVTLAGPTTVVARGSFDATWLDQQLTLSRRE